MARLSSVALVSAGLALLGCAPGFASPSQLRTLRVMAVKKDKPYARPGDTVKLQILLDDAAATTKRGVKVTWLGGCENPPGDLYAGCFDPGGPGRPPAIAKPSKGEGLEFSVPLSSDIISRRGTPPNPPAYGTAFVFFAVCPGEVRLDKFPIECVDPVSQKPYGADDFVAGYTQISVYDELNPDGTFAYTNANPVINGFSVDGKPVDAECIGDACVNLELFELGPADGGVSDGGLPPTDPCATAGPTCFDVCTKDIAACPKHTVQVEVNESASVELDTVQRTRDPSITLHEQMWINYYTDRGGLDAVAKLLNDAQLGWSQDHSIKASVPNVLGAFHVWAAVHDNRGGVEWARLRLETH